MPSRKVNAYTENKCLPSEHKRSVSTCWGLEFFSLCKIRAHAYPKRPSARWAHDGAWIIFSSCQIRAHAYPKSTSTRWAHAGAWIFFWSCPKRAHTHPKSTSTRWVHDGAWNIFLIIPNKRTCLLEEHKRLVSTWWDLIFFLIIPNKSSQIFFNHAKKEHILSPRAQALGEYMLGPGIFFWSCQIRAHAYPKSTSARWVHDGASIFFNHAK